MINSIQTGGMRPILVRIGWIFASVLVTYPIVGGIAASRSGQSGWLAAAIVGLVCFATTSLAMALTVTLIRAYQPIAAVIWGMLLRLAIPLALVFWIRTDGGFLEQSGAVGCLVAFYLVTLATETVLVLPLVSVSRPQMEKS